MRFLPGLLAVAAAAIWALACSSPPAGPTAPVPGPETRQLVVLYVGTDTGVLGLLERLLGPQFAGF